MLINSHRWESMSLNLKKARILAYTDSKPIMEKFTFFDNVPLLSCEFKLEYNEM